MSTDLTIALSPYHLCSRELPAMAALQLADRVVTLRPTPPAGPSRASVDEAVERCPQYLRFMLSWQWTVPLWHAGLLTSSLDNASPEASLPSLATDLLQSERYKPLRLAFGDSLPDDPYQELAARSNDLLKGGPNPLYALPITGAIDRFAAAHNLPVARPDPASLAQQLEARLATRRFSFAVPVLVSPSAEQILFMRTLMHEPRAQLAGALAPLLKDASQATRAHIMEIQSKVSAYCDHFDVTLSKLIEKNRHSDDPMARYRMVSVTVLDLPGDAVLRSSLHAARVASSTKNAPATPQPAPPSTPEPQQRVITMVMRELAATRVAPAATGA